MTPVKDTVVFQPTPVEGEAAAVDNPVDFEEHLYQNPTVALFKSLAVPGWGQLGNRRYVKAGIIISLELYFFSSAYHYNRQARDAKRYFDDAETISARNEWWDFLDNKRKNRNRFLWFAGLTVFFSMFDAYVDAHLSGSPKNPRNDRFDVTVVPDESGGATALLTLRF